LSLDALRAMEKSDALAVWAADVRRRLQGIKNTALSSGSERTIGGLQRIEDYAARAATAGTEFQQAGARAFAFAVARTEAAALLIEQANAQGDQAAVTAARRWCERELAHLVDADAGHRAESAALEHSQRQAG
jgi:hypothetical protein